MISVLMEQPVSFDELTAVYQEEQERSLPAESVGGQTYIVSFSYLSLSYQLFIGILIKDKYLI